MLLLYDLMFVLSGCFQQRQTLILPNVCWVWLSRNLRVQIPAAKTLQFEKLTRQRLTRGYVEGQTDLTRGWRCKGSSHLAGHEHWLHSSTGSPPLWSAHTERQQLEPCHRPAAKHAREQQYSYAWLSLSSILCTFIQCPLKLMVNSCLTWWQHSPPHPLWSTPLCPAAYLRLELSGGPEFKEELHSVVVSLLGGEEQGSRTWLHRKIKK